MFQTTNLQSKKYREAQVMSSILPPMWPTSAWCKGIFMENAANDLPVSFFGELTHKLKKKHLLKWCSHQAVTKTRWVCNLTPLRYIPRIRGALVPWRHRASLRFPELVENATPSTDFQSDLWKKGYKDLFIKQTRHTMGQLTHSGKPQNRLLNAVK